MKGGGGRINAKNKQEKGQSLATFNPYQKI